MTPGHDPVQKVTLIPRGQAKGLTWFIPGEDPSLISKQQVRPRPRPRPPAQLTPRTGLGCPRGPARLLAAPPPPIPE